MLRRHVIALSALALLGVVIARPALADEDKPDAPPAEKIPGEIHLSTPFEFVKFKLDEEADWENHEYTGKNKNLVIKGVSTDRDHVVTLSARDQPTLDDAVIEIKVGDWRKERVKGNVFKLVYRKAVKFPKKGEKKDAPKPPAKDAPKPGDKPAEKKPDAPPAAPPPKPEGRR